jgi:DNA-binding NarL/FixJ family response regulator
MSLRVAIVEDDSRYRGSLEQLLRLSPGFDLVASFSSPLPALKRAEATARAGQAWPWDVVVMDLEMPGMDGIEATRRLKEIHPEQRVVVLTVFEQPATILEAIFAGADGYLLKKARAPELLSALQAVSAGGGMLTPEVARRVLDLVRETRAGGATARHTAPARLDLTDREQQVLRGLVDGLSYKQVAAALDISLGTVRSHITAVYRKLQVHSVAEAVSRAVRQRLV